MRTYIPSHLFYFSEIQQLISNLTHITYLTYLHLLVFTFIPLHLPSLNHIHLYLLLVAFIHVHSP